MLPFRATSLSHSDTSSRNQHLAPAHHAHEACATEEAAVPRCDGRSPCSTDCPLMSRSRKAGRQAKRMGQRGPRVFVHRAVLVHHSQFRHPWMDGGFKSYLNLSCNSGFLVSVSQHLQGAHQYIKEVCFWEIQVKEEREKRKKKSGCSVPLN